MTHACPPTRSAFTLVEALAACAIAGLAAALGVGLLAPIAAGSSRASAVAAAAEAAERARLIAETRSEVITLRAGDSFTIAHESSARAVIHLPGGWSAAIYKDGRETPGILAEPLESVTFSGAGGAPGFTIALTGPRGGSAAVRVLAVTGQTLEDGQ